MILIKSRNRIADIEYNRDDDDNLIEINDKRMMMINDKYS